MNNDLEIISQWAYQWKMQFNPDKNKQAIQVIFPQKRDRSAHPLLYINRSEVILKHEQKHLGMILDSELNFYSHVKEKIVSARKAIGVMDNEDNEHYFLHCPRFAHQRRIMHDLVSRITNINIMRQSSEELCNLLLYRDSDSNVMINRIILEATLKYVKNSRSSKGLKRFP